MNSLRPAERRGGRNFYELRSAAHFGAPENPVVRTKTILSQFVASVQLTGVPLHIAIGESEFGGDVGVGQTIGMGCEKFQDRELPFLRARHAGDCSTGSYSGVLLIRCGPVVGERVHFVKFGILQRYWHDHDDAMADLGGFDQFHSVRIRYPRTSPASRSFAKVPSNLKRVSVTKCPNLTILTLMLFSPLSEFSHLARKPLRKKASTV